MATHSSILAWRILRTEKPCRLWSIASQSQMWLKQPSMHARREKKKTKTVGTHFFFKTKVFIRIKGYMVALMSVHLGLCMGVWVRLLEGRTEAFPSAPWTETIKPIYCMSQGQWSNSKSYLMMLPSWERQKELDDNHLSPFLTLSTRQSYRHAAKYHSILHTSLLF